jgi:hypothetical protein
MRAFLSSATSIDLQSQPVFFSHQRIQLTLQLVAPSFVLLGRPLVFPLQFAAHAGAPGDNFMLSGDKSGLIHNGILQRKS